MYAKTLTSSNPDLLFANYVLSFVQNFPYGKNDDYTDITDVVSVFTGKPSDCDSRAILFAIMMNMCDVRSTLFVSPEYAHAIVGSDIEGKGARIQVEDKSYLIGETTAKVQFGLIDQKMSNADKWINVPLP